MTLNGGTLALDMDTNDFNTTASTICTSLTLGNNVTVKGNATITANRLAAGVPINTQLFTQEVNKDVQLGTLGISNPGTTLTISPSSGYGVEFTGAANLFSTPLTTLTVNTNGSTTSNAVPSLILSGALTGTQNWTKAGTGTLLLTNSGNASTLSGNIQITAGVLAFTSDLALGAAGNQITFNGTGAPLCWPPMPP